MNRLAGVLVAALLVGCAHTPTPPDAAGWWNTLSPDQRAASFYGDDANDEDLKAVSPDYGKLDGPIRDLVHETASNLYGIPGDWPEVPSHSELEGAYRVIGSWWNSLHCEQMRIAVGDGNRNTHQDEVNSPFCRLYFAPADRADAPLLAAPERAVVNMVGSVLLVVNE